MSAIFGIFYLDGRPVEAGSLQDMKQAMTGWGPDGSAIWREGSVGLGHLMLYNTPESLHGAQPLERASGNLVLAASARLDNRADLFRHLDIPSSEQATLPDAELIVRAYERWGTDCPARLLGDWIMALWDADQRHLFIARDACGRAGLYYYQDNRIFAFSTSIKGVLALPQVPRRLNPEGLLGPRQWLGHGCSSLYEGIHRLAPARTLTVSTSGTDLQRYWHPSDVPDVRFKSDSDYLDAFLCVFTEAVRCRLRSHRSIGVMMSGGLDSGSVAALAARELAARGQRLLAFSSIPQYDTARAVTPQQRGNETPAIEAIRHHTGNIDVTYIRAEATSPLDGINRVLEILGQPMNEPMNLYWVVPLLETARRQGLGALLTGGGGNLTISWTGDRDAYLRSLFRRGQWRTWVQEAIAWRQVHHTSWGRTIRRQVLKPLLPSSGPASTQQRWLYEVLDSSVTSPWFELGEHFGLEIRDPTFDQRVIAFCLGLPPDQYTRHGQERLLVRRAMAGLLPESVRWETRKGKQAADIVSRLRASQAEVEMALNSLEQSAQARQYLDLERMKETFDSLQARLDPDLTDRVRFHFLRNVMIGLFLLCFDENQAGA